jgi:MoaA/NifB/PqqE/SkfB family radical SAM enzyme
MTKKWRREIDRSFINIEEKGMPLFYRVEVETHNRCNGACTFCPVNTNDDPRPYAKMTTELYEKIINELHDIDYSGILCLFCNNEPFIDTRLEAFAKKARELLPNAHIEIFTNGTVLTLERFIDIIPYLDLLAIDNYSDKLKWHEPVKVIRKYLRQHPEYRKKVSIRMRRESAIMSTRGGQAPNNKKKKTLPVSCLFPFYYMAIRPDGKVSLCCNDALGKYTLGDVSVQSLKDVWYGDAYSGVRTEIKKGRDTMDVCLYCDSYANQANLHRDDIGHRT